MAFGGIIRLEAAVAALSAEPAIHRGHCVCIDAGADSKAGADID